MWHQAQRGGQNDRGQKCDNAAVIGVHVDPINDVEWNLTPHPRWL
jgi:hypothetical protein